ncbi:MAG: hypothetical protein V1882_06300 [Candidatus Omnitrophota bacterium]
MEMLITPVMLNKLEWKILEGISYDEDEPFEVVDGIVKHEDPTLTPLDTLEILFKFYNDAYVVFHQIPITAFRQNEDFERKEIFPAKPAEIIRGVWNSFNQYCEKREYLEKVGDGGMPFGLYISLTDKAREEIKRKEYSEF